MTGRYDIECTFLRIVTEAEEGCIVIVLGGNKGTGMSAQLSIPMTHAIPSILRDVADKIEAARKKDEEDESPFKH